MLAGAVFNAARDGIATERSSLCPSGINDYLPRTKRVGEGSANRQPSEESR